MGIIDIIDKETDTRDILTLNMTQKEAKRVEKMLAVCYPMLYHYKHGQLALPSAISPAVYQMG